MHDRAWILPYQLWLAERALQGALFHLLRGDATSARFARDVVRACAERYLTYPNQDNVLGPTRLFFSTYLESIWLLQICFTADFLAAAGDHATAEIARDRIVEPSSAIIAGYDEGMSNRQVWNNAALIAASLLLGRERDIDALTHGPCGVEAHLSGALLADGTWYEGENYHQFALRGLWYCVTMLEVAGVTLRDDLCERFQRAFATPFVTALPDFTMPSRKDSQYAVSLRQWRLAELTELGFARREDAMLGGALARMYEEKGDRQDTGRARSTADVERNSPGTRLTRADLGWRALLHALPDLPALRPFALRSALLESQGYAVFRRDGHVYVGFECGQSGGGHGHPDRLNVTLYQGQTRWLDDFGTGSYVHPSLHWYRSTLAHNAPLVNGASQPLHDARLVAWDEREGLGWIVAQFDIPALDARLERAVVVAPEYMIVELRWTAAAPVRVHEPWHLGGLFPRADEDHVAPEATSGEWSYLRDFRRVIAPVTDIERDGRRLHYALATPPDITALQALAPGQPFARFHETLLLQGEGSKGSLCSILAWGDGLRHSRSAGALTITVRDETHVHRRDERGWHVELHTAGARSSIDLAGFRRTPPGNESQSRPPRVPMRLHRTSTLVYELGEPHYRRSEVNWHDAGKPAASIAIRVERENVEVSMDVRAGDAMFATADAENPYDNEHPDTMRAGVQLYAMIGDSLHAWMLVPEVSSRTVRARLLAGDVDRLVESEWHRTPTGYEMRVVLALGDSFSMDVIVNETVRGRERRRGQLVMSGARGEFVFLRGDRHDSARLIPMVVVP